MMNFKSINILTVLSKTQRGWFRVPNGSSLEFGLFGEPTNFSMQLGYKEMHLYPRETLFLKKEDLVLWKVVGRECNELAINYNKFNFLPN